MGSDFAIITNQTTGRSTPSISFSNARGMKSGFPPSPSWEAGDCSHLPPMAHRGFGVYLSSCEATREINTKITLEWAQKHFATSILLLTRHNESINEDKTTIFTYRHRVSLAGCSFCWWRHNRSLMISQWPDNCDAITWIMISNSLDIDFIHSDIQSRSNKRFL